MKYKNQASEDHLPDLLQQLRSKGDGLRSPHAAYFENLADKVVQQVSSPQTTTRLQTANLTASRPQKYYLRWVAVAALVLSGGWWAWQSVVDLPVGTHPVAASWEVQLDALSQEDLTAYIQENIQEFELEILLATND